MDLELILKVSTAKVGAYILCGYSMSAFWTFHCIEKKHDVYRGEDCMKKFFEYLITNFEKKKMILLKTKSRNRMRKQKYATFA